MNKIEPLEATVLGKQVDYPSAYSPEILVAVPRQLNRVQYDIDDHQLPFTGGDVWHAWEAGFMTNKGMPVCGVLKIIYPAASECIVESKSLKLYLNSFNMERLGETVNDGIQHYVKTIRNDLEKLLKVPVQVNFFVQKPSHAPFDFHGFKVLEQMPGVENLMFENFVDSPQLLALSHDRPSEIRVATHLLRSNCKITHQPDWGSAFIHMKSEQTPDVMSILKYIVSFRNENHFHEEICEMLYKRLFDFYQPELLMVTCVYTRRGGIDICPIRVSQPNLTPMMLGSIGMLSDKLLRQ